MANEKRLIDKFRDELMGEFIGLCHGNDFNRLSLLRIGEAIDRVYDRCDTLSTVDAVEVVHGCNVYDHDTSFECSVCGWVDWDTMTADSSKYNYCPNCGAKMDGDGNG